MKTETSAAKADAARRRIALGWTYRLVLDREGTPAEIEAALKSEKNAATLALTLAGGDEFSLITATGRAPLTFERSDAFIAIRIAFRIFLGRELTNESDMEPIADAISTTSELRRMLVMSDEFRVLARREFEVFITAEVVRQFRPFHTQPAAESSFRDFIGSTTRCAFLPAGFERFSGAAFSFPGAKVNKPIHDTAEWVGTLRAVLEATQTFTVVELGAGWAPWLAAGHICARSKGIEEVHLLGVEGSAEHQKFMEQNLLDNGIDPKDHKLIYGVVGPADGIARFPDIESASDDYGASAIYDGPNQGRRMIEVPCFSIPTLLADLPPVVDIIHCDIQGSEAEVMGAALPTLDGRVRRVVIGTHGRKEEGELLLQFSSIGWRLEHETVCEYRQQPDGVLGLALDGVQVWRNSKL